MQMTQSFHISLEVWGGIFCAIAAYTMWLGREDRKDRIVVWMELTTTALLVSDGLAWVVRGTSGMAGYVGVRILNFAVFALTYTLAIEYTTYVVELLKDKTGFPIYTWLWAGYMLNLLGLALVVANINTGLFYYFDEQNFYHRADSYYLLMVVGFMGIVMNLMLLIFNYHRFEKTVFWALMSYLVLPIAAGVFQTLHYGVAVLNMAIAVSMLLIFLVWQVERNRQQMLMRNRLLLQEKKMAQMQQDIMLSQIQPHFLYNSLSAIAMLCEKEPKQAKKATIAFADYLRGNMDALSEKEPIPFERELTHIENYLRLEQIRFGEELEVIYDIETVDFKVPVLSVQPLVENAVKHGIKRKGTVVIHTQENPEDFEVQVIDDGVGFDPDRIEEVRADTKRSHVGITNARNRLMELCHGTLEYISKPQEGTTVILRVPKNPENALKMPAEEKKR